MNDKFFRMIGLSMRAGKIEVGEAKTEDRLRCGKSRLVIISEDASENTVKKFSSLCKNHKVPFVVAGNREILGNYTGRDFAVVLTVSDEGFAKRLTELADDTKIIESGRYYEKG